LKSIFTIRVKSKFHLVLLVSQLAIVLYYLPYFLLGENATLLIHDNLDSNIAWIKVLLENGSVFASPSKINEQVLNGLPTYSVYGTYDISLIVFKIFGVYTGYVVNKLFISFIGFWGMFLLLRKHFSPQPSSTHLTILVGVSLAFSLLPFWSFSATVLGLPFALFAFLNLRNNDRRISNYVIIFLFAFYSSLVLSGIFFLLILSIVWVYDFIKNRKINWPFFLGLSLLSSAYLISHIPLIYGVLFDGTASHRSEFQTTLTGFKNSFHLSYDLFKNGQYHASSLHYYFSIPITIILIVWYKSFSKKVKLSLVFIVLTSLFYGFRTHSSLAPIVEQINQIVPIQLQRFHFLHPMFWYVLMAVCLIWASNKVNNLKIGVYLVYAVIVFQIYFVVKQHEIWVNRSNPSFKAFYSEATFTKIKKSIGKPIESYKVISVGIHPSVAQYNGFYTLDGYFPSYPLDYKHEFRKVIAGELERDESVKSYFDNWGSRCYAFSSELGLLPVSLDFVSNTWDPIDTLDFNFQHLRSMGGAYIISTHRISESFNPEIKLIEVIDVPGDYWTIYLYENQAKLQISDPAMSPERK